MGTIEAWTTFFGWCTVINMGLYVLTVVAYAAMRDWAVRINARIFAVSEEEVRRATFQYIARYKLAITVLCFVPWLALTLMV